MITPDIEEKQLNSSVLQIKEFFAENDKSIYIFLTSYFKIHKPYLNRLLSLESLSKETKIPSHTISRIINNYSEKNVPDFVNMHRVEECKRYLTYPKYKNFKLETIALKCGFSSKAAFYEIFKKYTGLTPNEFRKLNT